jgi:hypothetical protein
LPRNDVYSHQMGILNDHCAENVIQATTSRFGTLYNGGE